MSLESLQNSNIDSSRVTAIEFYKKKLIRHQTELARLKDCENTNKSKYNVFLVNESIKTLKKEFVVLDRHVKAILTGSQVFLVVERV